MESSVTKTFLAEILDLFNDPKNPDHTARMTKKVDLLVQLNPLSDPKDNHDKCKLMDKTRFSGIHLEVGKVGALNYFRDENGFLKFNIRNASTPQSFEYKNRWKKSRDEIFKDVDFNFFINHE